MQLGQPNFWQNQGVSFKEGEHVTITGFYENGQFQASTVKNDANGQTLTLRDATGQPQLCSTVIHHRAATEQLRLLPSAVS